MRFCVYADSPHVYPFCFLFWVCFQTPVRLCGHVCTHKFHGNSGYVCNTRCNRRYNSRICATPAQKKLFSSTSNSFFAISRCAAVAWFAAAQSSDCDVGAGPQTHTHTSRYHATASPRCCISLIEEREWPISYITVQTDDVRLHSKRCPISKAGSRVIKMPECVCNSWKSNNMVSLQWFRVCFVL